MGLGAKLRFFGTITIKAATSLYVSAQKDGRVTASSRTAQSMETFTVKSHPTMRKVITLSASNGKYLSCTPQGMVTCMQDKAGELEAFVPYDHGLDQMLLYGKFSGCYLSVDTQGNIRGVIAPPGAFETFTYAATDKKYLPVHLQSVLNKKFVFAEWGNSGCSKDVAQGCETFEIIPLGPNVVALRSKGTYLGVDEKNKDIIATADKVGPKETFTICNAGGYKLVALLTCLGTYAHVGNDSSLKATGTTIGPQETFEMIKAVRKNVVLCASNGKYLSVSPNESVVADRPTPDKWSVFNFNPLRKDVVTIRGPNNKYVCEEKSKKVTVSRDKAKSQERFIVETVERSENAYRIKLKAFNGSYLGLDTNGTIVGDRGNAGVTETFYVINV